MASTRDIRRRIKSIKNTRQITKAMEKVSAVKMKRSQAAAVKSRRYAALAFDILESLEGNVEKNIHPLFKQRERHRVGYILLSSDKGLCGSLNTRLTQGVLASLAEQKIPRENVVFYALGKRSRDSILRFGYHLEADFGAMPHSPSGALAEPVLATVLADFMDKKIDAVFLAYTHFVNTLAQTPTVRQLLPFERSFFQGQARKDAGAHFQYVFEPSPEEVLESALHRILALQIYQGVLEHNASEHSARMVAMKSATENANDLIGELTLMYNQIRQAGITREMAEISAGGMA